MCNSCPPFLSLSVPLLIPSPLILSSSLLYSPFLSSPLLSSLRIFSSLLSSPRLREEEEQVDRSGIKRGGEQSHESHDAQLRTRRLRESAQKTGTYDTSVPYVHCLWLRCKVLYCTLIFFFSLPLSPTCSASLYFFLFFHLIFRFYFLLISDGFH